MIREREREINDKFLCTVSYKRDLIAFADPKKDNDYFETSRRFSLTHVQLYEKY